MIEAPPKDEKCIFDDGKEWRIHSSTIAKRCKNYIRDIVDNLNLDPNPEKPVIALSIGDPTVYGNLKASEESIQAIIKVAENGRHNGYAPCVGFEDSRQAVADYLSHDGVELDAKDIILCSGCSSSLEMCITAIADGSKGQNILMPQPGFPIYRTLAECIGIKVKTYRLLPDRDWQVDLNDLESKIDSKTAVIVLNNPSNPCGSVFDENHLQSILDIAYRHRVPIIADEIYEQLVFPPKRFVSTASLDSGVPILICGGLAKRFLVPGWRLGWIVIHDPIGAFDSEIRKALICLSQRTIGSNTLIQGAIEDILLTSQNFHDELIRTLYNTSKLGYDMLSDVPGLHPYMPDGTMYMMVKIEMEHFPQFKSGLEFMQTLMKEESVFCLPGDCFEIPGFMRLVTTVPEEKMKEACERMQEFCNKYYT